MGQTATTLADVLKDGWRNRLAKQFYTDHQPLTRLSAQEGTTIGKQVQVPIFKEVTGGYTSVGSAGGSLNTAGNAGVDQATYSLVGHWQPINLDFSVLNQASGNNLQSVVNGKDLEIESALESMRRQATRQLVTNGDGIVAQCDTGGASTTIELIASPSGTAYGYDAIVRGWLRPGTVVDVGTTADTDALVSSQPITGINESASDPDIITATSATTTNGTHFVYIANPNSATAANPEMNGLRNIVNTTGALGGLNPSNAGEEFWAAPVRDTSTTVFSLDLALNLDRSVKQKSGKPTSSVWTSLKQQMNFYSLLQNQVRFAGDTKLGAGNVNAVTWNGMEVEAYNDILDSDWFHLSLDNIFRVVGSYKDPVWMSDVQGANQGALWGTGTTSFNDAVAHYFNIGVDRRNVFAGATGLTA
jgi:hypothetical protein